MLLLQGNTDISPCIFCKQTSDNGLRRRRKTMKKTVALILSLSMLLMLFACGSGNSSTSTTRSSTASSGSAKSSSVSFTNKYGTATTKCAHSGCSNYIASSGDTNCCKVHSNKCLECGKYIDEDATYCMSCLSKASDKAKAGSSKSSTSGGKSSASGSASGNKCHFKENGKEVCNNQCASGSNFCSYHQKYLDDAYNSLFE